ncbi:MAG: hypothetical protein IT379_32170 [Deltaproteobacteria bacterium]|nr:hypothetical protein [Deltaproteobacteria bacterium]
MEAIRPFVLHAPALTTSARAWLAAIERHRGTPRSREPAHLAVHAVGCVEVYVDGQMRGTTPLEIDLAPGNYTQALRACGSDRARIGPLVLGPNDRVIERLSADGVARLGGP